MRAVAIDSVGGPDKLRPMEIPRPRAERGEVLIRVVAAGVDLLDWRTCRGELPPGLTQRFPMVPGWTAAGVVEELGDGATRMRKGDRIWAYARKDTIQWGCWAEYVAVRESCVGLMPAKLLFEEAAAVPLAALQAWQALFGIAGVSAESTVVLHGAAGGAAHFAIQLAKNRGARTYAAVGGNQQALVVAAGTDGVVDFGREDWTDALGRMVPDGGDLLLDCSADDDPPPSLSLLREGGTFVGIAADPAPVAADAERADVRAVHLLTEPDMEQLDTIARMFDRKELRVEVEKIYRMNEAAAALRAVGAGSTRGALVLGL